MTYPAVEVAIVFNGLATQGTPGKAVPAQGANKSFQAWATSTAGGAAALDVQASMDGVRWCKLGTINLTLTANVEANDGFSSADRFPLVRLMPTTVPAGTTIALQMGA